MTLIDDVLDGLRLQSTVFSRMTLLGDWGFAKDTHAGAPFHLVLSGRTWIETGADGGVGLGPGDVVILPRGDPHRLLSRPGVPAEPWRRVREALGWPEWTPGMRIKAADLRMGSGQPSTTMISGVFAFGDRRRNPLLEALPAVLLLRASADSAAARAVATIASLLNAEISSGTPGAESVSLRLADILFVQVVRHYLSRAEQLPQGWLRGIGDQEIGPALAIMHRSPDRLWSVASLAKEVGMSRSRFAARFQDTVGQGPLEYLTDWRMYLAAGRLADGKVSMADLAASAGYRSDVAFSKAFKRWAGSSPAEYRRSLAGPARGSERARAQDRTLEEPW